MSNNITSDEIYSFLDQYCCTDPMQRKMLHDKIIEQATIQDDKIEEDYTKCKELERDLCNELSSRNNNE